MNPKLSSPTVNLGLGDHAVTLVLNPHARKLKLNAVSVEEFKALLPPDSEVHLTQTLDELHELMGNWKNGERTLCFYGGDGSISQGLTSLIRHHGEDFVLPPVLPVRAGTINLLCNFTGKRESALQTLESWNNKEAHAIRAVPTLRVQVNNQSPRYGFVFAWGIGYRVLTEYYRRNEAPSALGGAAVATQAFLQAISPFSETLPLFKKESLEMRIDGATALTQPLHTLTIGTVPRLSLGIRPFPPQEIRPGSFSFSANGMPLFKVAAYTPTLLFGLGDQTQLDFGPQLICGAGTREIDCLLSGGFTMDGEMIELPERSRVKISPGPVVRFWTRRIDKR